MALTRSRIAVTAVNALLVGALAWLALEATDAPAEVSHLPRLEPLPWAPPSWFPGATADELWVLEHLDGDGQDDRDPRVRARSALVADLDLGEVLWSHNPDDPRPVASLTKLVSGLALASTDPDLDRELCVSWEQWPSRPGARSRFETGTCHQGWEYLGAALVSSDNRGAMAFPALADLEYWDFLDRMDRVSGELRLEHATWADPSGLEDENMATARDMLKAVVAVSAHPVLQVAATAPFWQIDRDRGRRRLLTTNRLRGRWEVLAAKTGYTDTARWCFATVVRTASGRRLAVSVLGAPTNRARFDAAARMVRWAEGRDG